MLKYKIKTGIGFDVHAFAPNRKLIIGGVDIPYDKGLEGHSDADVLSHAVSDALTGVTLGKDIGCLFPDNDMKFKDADSIALLKEAGGFVKHAGYFVSSVDATIIAQSPKMAPYIPEMRRNIAKVLELDFEDVTIKATTSEKLGFTGRGEGIACIAVATVWKENIKQ